MAKRMTLARVQYCSSLFCKYCASTDYSAKGISSRFWFQPTGTDGKRQNKITRVLQGIEKYEMKLMMDIQLPTPLAFYAMFLFPSFDMC